MSALHFGKWSLEGLIVYKNTQSKNVGRFNRGRYVKNVAKLSVNEIFLIKKETINGLLREPSINMSH